MKQRFTEEQIVKVLNEHQNSRPATEIVRELGIAEQTFYNWKHKKVRLMHRALKTIMMIQMAFQI